MAASLVPKIYRSANKPTWCPGCGDYGVLEATTRALATLQVEPHRVAVVSGIGCSSRFPIFLNAYGFHSVHGRVLPIATGLKVANPELTVLAVGGDGDGLAIGAGHFPHAARRNPDITYIMMDNSIYGLTKGQISPTSRLQQRSSTTPWGNVDRPLNPVAMAVAAGASFVARGVSWAVAELADLIRQGIEHRGFAFIHAVSPCPTFNNTLAQIKPRVAPLPQGYDPTDPVRAFELALHTEALHTGVLYREPETIPYEERLAALEPPTVQDRQTFLQSLIDAYR
ncbi:MULTISPECIES: 2-oxoacid:ferredoxin oxidoreductase subunit beta [Limnochorda]|uniref:2-oxoacid:ferredoxin oxidoreductase subunit beta n=1 Tax=Limnochorda TaxID=1676651 RepID=UPI0017989F54|nr:2-oxoacid:ferredoxin oxidoreductase subunit beta [Limnochorda pilosa]MBO2486105.1 2-oxoacid ferredoxin oxidoreductase [Bacillota bacterium]MBO2519085.1 2-oxoacid ferredoxin oxidoreductase [Bacillota bacterium]NMA72472.1 2-oxoacid:ferredoxin oxidoreductase subunit beta [Bacillota bacterium]